jgi:hypothetical protein
VVIQVAMWLLFGLGEDVSFGKNFFLSEFPKGQRTRRHLPSNVCDARMNGACQYFRESTRLLIRRS